MRSAPHAGAPPDKERTGSQAENRLPDKHIATADDTAILRLGDDVLGDGQQDRGGHGERTLQTAEFLADAWHGAMEITARIARENGYRQGWFAGVAEEREAWSRIIGAYADVTQVPGYAARNEQRDDPCATRCGKCSRCVRAAAVARYGGDFLGSAR